MTFTELRMRDRWTRRLLAEKLGLDQSTVAKWETTKNYPKIATIKKIAEILNVSTIEVLESLERQKESI